MKIKWFSILVILCVFLAGCTGTNKLVGSWVDSEGGSYEFYKDGSVTISSLGIPISGTYELIDKETIKLTFDGLLGLGGSTILTYKVAGNQLTLTIGDQIILLEKKTQ